MIKLYNGDMLVEMDKIEDKSVDMILTDLPYGTTACSWDTIIPFEPLWKQYNRVIKDNGAIVLFGSEPFSSHLRMSNIKNYKYDWIWNKKVHSSPLLAKKQPLRIYENISVFYKSQVGYTPQMSKGKPYKRDYGYEIHKNSINDTNMITSDNETGDRYPLNIIEFPLSRNNRVRLHPTQKPIELLEYLIKTYTNENDVVLDSTMGSGSTGVACKRTNRRFIGIEMDKNYFKIAKDRIDETQYVQEKLNI